MTTIPRVLVVVDPYKDARQASVVRGVMLATAMKVGIELLIVHRDREYTDLRVKSPHGWKEARHKIVNAHADHLEAIAAQLVVQGVDVLISVTCDWPLDEGIVRHALYTNPKIVIRETHYHSVIGRAAFNFTDWNLIRTCPVPLWLARDTGWVPNAPVMACVDREHQEDRFSLLDDKIVGIANDMSSCLGGETHVFNALAPIYIVDMPDTVPAIRPRIESDHSYENKHREDLDKFVESFGIKKENVHFVPGFPKKELPSAADKIGCSLVVLGAIAKNRMGRVLIGNTAEQVLDKLAADVLVVKPNWFHCPVDAISHADTKKDPEGHVFQVRAGLRKSRTGKKLA